MKEQIKQLASYVPEEPLAAVKKRYGLKKLVRLSANENPFGTSSKVKKAIVNWNFSETNRYPDGNATLLRNAVAKKLQVDPKKIVFGDGLDEIIELISRVFLKPGDEVLQTSPTFSEYGLHAAIEGAQVVKVPCDPQTGKHDFKGLLAKIESKTKLIWICNPNNPTGAYATPTELAEFAAQIPQNILLLIDEAYIHYATDEKKPSALPLLKRFSNVVVMRTFSKVYGLANYRVGFAVMDQKLADYLQAVRLPYNLNSLSQVGALAALKDQQFVAVSIKKTAKERQKWENFFEQHQIKYFHSQANFIFFKYPQALELADYLLKKGFQLRRGLAEDWLRLTIGKKEDGEKLRALIDCYQGNK